MELKHRKCVPCEGGVPKLEADRVNELLPKLDGWMVVGDRLVKHHRFPDFKAAMRFANAIADVAEAEGHHPDFTVRDWNVVDVSIWTHAIGGLSENDFILAAKIDALPREAAAGR